eukprot:447987_1
MSTLELSALENQDGSRLACGVLEKFVFSINRDKLLFHDPKTKSTPAKEDNIQNINDYEDQSEDENDDNEPNQTTTIDDEFILGSDEHVFYQMLQIENQIENQIEKQQTTDNSDMKIDAIDELNVRFNALVAKIKQKYKKSENVPINIYQLIRRHQVRDLVAIDPSKQLKALNNIQSELNISFNFEKPKEINQGMYEIDDNNLDIDKKINSSITQSELKNVLNKQLNKVSLNELEKENFHSAAIPFLLKQQNHLDIKCKNQILKQFSNKILIFSEAQENDNDDVLNMIVENIQYCSEEKQKNKSNFEGNNNNTFSFGIGSGGNDRIDGNEEEKNKNILFGYHKCHFQLTLEQMQKLKSMIPAIIKNKEFINQYCRKLVPLQLQTYHNKDWNLIPLCLRYEYIQKLYEFVNRISVQNIEQNAYLLNVKLYVYELWIAFTERNNYFMDEISSPYDLEAIIIYFTRTIFKSDKTFKMTKLTRFANSCIDIHLSSMFSNADITKGLFGLGFIRRLMLYLFANKEHYKQFVKNYDGESLIIKEFLNSVSVTDCVLVAFSEFIDEKILVKYKNLANLNSSHEAKENEIYLTELQQHFGDSYVKSLKKWIIFEFDKYRNKKYFKLNDYIELYVNVKNGGE